MANDVIYDMQPLRALVAGHEDWLVQRVLDYAKQRNYVKYTATPAEAWRVSIAGLSASLIQAMGAGAAVPEFGPDEDFTKDPAASFGMLEARRHHARGVTLAASLGMLKYSRQCCLDLVSHAEFDPQQKYRYLLFLCRCFDRMELGFASEWCAQPAEETLAGIQAANRELSNEKNLFLTIFESMPDPVILFDEQHVVVKANHAALQLLTPREIPSFAADREKPFAFPAWVHTLPDLLPPEATDVSFTRRITNGIAVFFEIRLRRIPDVSGKFSGTIVVLKDITQRQSAQEALTQSEKAFRALFENSRDAIMLLDKKGFFDCNKATLDLFGCESKEQFVEKHPSELSPPGQPDGRESLVAAREYIETAYADGVKFFEWTHRRKDGSFFPAEVLLSRFELGDRTALQAVVRDITERNKAERYLREGRDALQRKNTELNRIFTLVEIGKREWERTMDCIDDMVILVDAGNRLKRCNRSFSQFMGKSYDKLLGAEWAAILTEQNIEITGLLENSGELYHAPTMRWFTVKSYAVTGISSDNGSGFVVTFHDITARKEMTYQLETTNRQIEESRQNLQCALDELSDLIQRVEKEQTFDVRFTNPNLVTCHEVLGCTTKACPCHGKPAVRCWQIAGTHCGGAVQGTTAQKFNNCTGCVVFKAATSNPIYQIGEHFNNMMHILDLKNRELQTAYSELKLTQSKILQQEKMASIGQLAAGVAHEINNPMGFISSNLGTLRKYLDRMAEFTGVLTGLVAGMKQTALDEQMAAARGKLKIDVILDDAQKLVSESLDGTDRVKTIVQNLKSFSRVDQAEAKPADINECIESTLNIVWNELKYKAEVRKEYGLLPLTVCFPQQLNQVFMNLLVNAGQAIMERGEISIRTWADDHDLYVAVADTGMGIPGTNIEKIFEPFFTTKEIGKGTGLGLSITYDIIKKHHGDITVRSEVGKGTTFTVRIPVIKEKMP